MKGRSTYVAILAMLMLTTTSSVALAVDSIAASNENGVSQVSTNEASSEVYSIIVTGSRTKETIYNTNADISVVTKKEMEMMNMTTLDDVLRTVPGVQFLDYGGTGLNANISGIRINGSKDVVILVDGVRMTDFQGSGSSGYIYAGQTNNLDNIERIEVLRGSAGVLYGSGAKGGVINIITKTPNRSKVTVDVAGGSFDTEKYRFAAEGKEGNLGYRAYYTKSLQGDIKDGAGVTWKSHSDTKSQGLQVGYDISKKNKMTFNYDEMKSDFSGTDPIYINNYKGWYESKSFTIKDEHYFNDKWSNMFTFRQNHQKSQYAQSANGNPLYTTSPNDYTYTFLSDQVTFTTDKHTLVFGLDYGRGKSEQELSTRINNQIVRTKPKMENYSWFVQEDWKVLPNVTLSGGLRYDDPSGGAYGANFASHTSKSYGLAWDITKKDKIHMGRSDFYILPSMTQLYDTRYGNALLRPAEGRTTSFGYSRQFSKDSVFTWNYFKTEDELTIGYDGNGYYRNYSDGVARGWTAQYMTQIGSKWNARVGWSHLYQYASGDTFSRGYYPKDLITLNVYYTNKKLSAGLEGFYFIRRMNSATQRMLEATGSGAGWPSDKFTVFNVSVNYSPNKQYTFYARVDNVFDKLWAEHTNVIWGGAPGTWYSMPGRSFTIGVKGTF